MIRIEWNNFLFLPKRGWLIDIGCRGFLLSRIAAGRGMKVIAVDPASDISKPEIQNIFHEQLAIVGSKESKSVDFYMSADKQKSYIGSIDSLAAIEKDIGKQALGQEDSIKVPAMTLDELLHKYGLSQVEILKLNCEGAEEQILLNLKRPLAHQISVEFHRHLGFPGFTDEIRNHMRTWYNWVSSIENHPFQRVVFYLKGDRKLYIYAIFSKIQVYLYASLYLAKEFVYTKMRSNYYLRMIKRKIDKIFS